MSWDQLIDSSGCCLKIGENTIPPTPLFVIVTFWTNGKPCSFFLNQLISITILWCWVLKAKDRMFADTPPCFLSQNMSSIMTNSGVFYPYIVGDCWSQSISDIPMTSSSNSLFHNTSNTIVLKPNNVYILYLQKPLINGNFRILKWRYCTI